MAPYVALGILLCLEMERRAQRRSLYFLQGRLPAVYQLQVAGASLHTACCVCLGGRSSRRLCERLFEHTAGLHMSQLLQSTINATH